MTILHTSQTNSALISHLQSKPEKHAQKVLGKVITQAVIQLCTGRPMMDTFIFKRTLIAFQRK